MGHRKIQQIDKLTGEIIAEFPSVREASKQTKIPLSCVSRYSRGRNLGASEFLWVIEKFKVTVPKRKKTFMPYIDPTQFALEAILRTRKSLNLEHLPETKQVQEDTSLNFDSQDKSGERIQKYYLDLNLVTMRQHLKKLLVSGVGQTLSWQEILKCPILVSVISGTKPAMIKTVLRYLQTNKEIIVEIVDVQNKLMNILYTY